MPDSEELSSLERVRQRLYDPKVDTSFHAPQLDEHRIEKPSGWEHLKEVREETERMSGPARFFIVALIFFVVTGGGAAFYLLYGGRAVSTNNINLTTAGPTTIASGDTVPLLITVENRNPVTIHEATITVAFPEGTKSADDSTQLMPVYTENVGDIAPGGKVERTVRSAVFGSEGQQVTLPVKVEYHTDSSSSVFVKNKQFGFLITTSPITLNVTALSQVSSGQSVTVDVLVRSNASGPLDNVAISAEYPFGFTPSNTDPAPTTGTLFVLGTLKPSEERHIKITGVLSGENNDDRVFKFSAGTLSAPDAPTLTTSYTSKEADIKLTKPFLSTTLAINHDTSDNPVIDSSMPAQAIITWTNTLPNQITNAHITVALKGDALDPASVSGSGFYRSSDTTVIFDASTNPALAVLQPGATGQGTFNFSTKKGSALSLLQNPSISFTVSVSGQRIGESQVPETISSTLTRTVKVATNLALVSRLVRTIGPFANTGPWPATPNTQSTYTVIYTLSNSGNSVAGAKVTAALPPYVTYTGKVSPNDGSVTYNDTTRTVTWNAGDVASGAGASKQMAFQIGFTPSTSQVNTSPVLLHAQQVTGVDRFTQHQISGTVGELNTQITTDPAYSIQFGAVK